jgi:hypothetical protein
MARKKASHAPPPSKKQKTSPQAEVALLDDEDASSIQFPRGTFSRAVRAALRAPACTRHFLSSPDESTQAQRLVVYVFNGDVAANPSFKESFGPAFGDWSANGDDAGSNSKKIVDAYSPILSDAVTEIKMRWRNHELDQDHADGLWDCVVSASRKCMSKNLLQILFTDQGTLRQKPEIKSMFEEATEVSSCSARISSSTSNCLFLVQTAILLQPMKKILIEGKTTKNMPFCKTGIYPYFAVFATFYGTWIDTERYSNLSALANGEETFQSLITLHDRVFLFYIFATFSLHEHGSLPRGWYKTKKAARDIDNITHWMKIDDKEKHQADANKSIIEHMKGLKGDLEDFKCEVAESKKDDVFDD